MPRIDMLTAQMRQRAVNRVSIRQDEKIQLFDTNDQILGEGAALSGQTIREILTEIAPTPLNDTPTTFPYEGRDGQFQISVTPGVQGFEIRTLSFTPVQTELLPNITDLEPQPVVTPVKDEWFYLSGQQQIGPYPSSHIKAMIRSGGIRRGTFLWQEGMAEWVAVEQSEFKAVLPALPNSWGDSENIWYYRSMTGQPVPLDKSQLVEKLRSGELTGDAWVWHKGMLDWANASSTELASALPVRPMNAGGAPIAPPVGGGHPLPGPYGGVDINTSGGGANVEVPREARGLFNVGAFLFPALWCFSMGMPALGAAGIGLNVIRYARVPYVYRAAWIVKIILSFYLGFTGNKLAWRYRRFDSIRDFNKCQSIWGMVSGIIYALFFVVALALGAFISSQVTSSFP